MSDNDKKEIIYSETGSIGGAFFSAFLWTRLLRKTKSKKMSKKNE